MMNFPSVNNVLTIYDEINISVKTWKRIVSVVKNVPQKKFEVLEKLKKIDCFYQFVLFVAKKLTFTKIQELHNFDNISDD